VDKSKIFRLTRGVIGTMGLAALTMSPSANAAEIYVLMPPEKDYATICSQSDAASSMAGADVDWASWSADAPAVPAAEALAHARDILAEPSRGEVGVALALLKKLADGAGRERAAALYELSTYYLYNASPDASAVVDGLRRSLALGYGRAAVILGEIYELGLVGQAQDLAKAQVFYKLAVQSRVEDGALKLAELARRTGRQAEAVQWLVLAQQMMAFRLSNGDCSQLLEIAKLYLNGVLLPRAPDVGARWLEAAHAAGYSKASRLLGEMLLLPGEQIRDVERGLGLLSSAADAGDVEALLVIGRFLRGDFGDAPNWREALVAFEKSAAAVPPNPGAFLELGRTLRDGPAGVRDMAAAEASFRKAVEARSLPALREFGVMQLDGDPADVAEGLQLLRMAAKERDLTAAASLGRWLVERSVTDGERAEGVTWLKSAADAGHGGAAKTLARLYSRQMNFAAAGPYWKQVAEDGDPEAFVELAALKQSGRFDAGQDIDQLLGGALAASESNSFGFVLVGRAIRDGRFGEPDRSAAFKLFERAADAGDPIGLREAGLALASGDGVRRDQETSRSMLQRASGAGDQIATVLLARGLIAGWFGETDVEGARRALEQAANGGSGPAALELAGFYSRGAFGAIDQEMAVKWWLVAAAANEIEAMRSLANAYGLGFGVDSDLAKSVDWLERAAAMGDAESMHRLAYIYRAGVGVQANASKADHWSSKLAANASLAEASLHER